MPLKIFRLTAIAVCATAAGYAALYGMEILRDNLNDKVAFADARNNLEAGNIPAAQTALQSLRRPGRVECISEIEQKFMVARDVALHADAPQALASGSVVNAANDLRGIRDASRFKDMDDLKRNVDDALHAVLPDMLEARNFAAMSADIDAMFDAARFEDMGVYKQALAEAHDDIAYKVLLKSLAAGKPRDANDALKNIQDRSRFPDLALQIEKIDDSLYADAPKALEAGKSLNAEVDLMRIHDRSRFPDFAVLKQTADDQQDAFCYAGVKDAIGQGDGFTARVSLHCIRNPDRFNDYEALNKAASLLPVHYVVMDPPPPACRTATLAAQPSKLARPLYNFLALFPRVTLD